MPMKGCAAMVNYHEPQKAASFFEGWYLKHQNSRQTLSLIPSVHISESGERSAFLQIVTNSAAYNIAYPYRAFCAAGSRFAVKVGGNIFTSKGIRLCVNRPEVSCSGIISYNTFTPPNGDAMGPFRFLPFLPCNHGVLSLHHNLRGKITLNGEKYDFDNGVGYIEKDWGRSFPKRYMWLHCNQFKNAEKCSIMASVAELPAGVCSKTFWGCLCTILYGGREYRIATYNGGKIILADENLMILRRGEYVLKIKVKKQDVLPLFAPKSGKMARKIYEAPACPADFTLYRGDCVVFSLQSDCASYEFAGQ